ncbi:helix-turn-helix domain-containing protein [candidate division KSB1 bacterium]
MIEEEQNNFDLENPGLFIRHKREFFNLSQEELAYLSGINQSYISLIENGNKIPSLDVLKKLLYVLNSEVRINDNAELKPDVKKLSESFKKEMSTIKKVKKRLENLRDKNIIEGENPDS